MAVALALDEGINCVIFFFCTSVNLSLHFAFTLLRREAHITTNSGRHAHIIQAGELHVQFEFGCATAVWCTAGAHARWSCEHLADFQLCVVVDV